MHSDPSTERSDGSKTDPLDGRQNAVLLLQRALMSFRGHSPFGHLGEIHRLAVERHEYTGSLEEAAEVMREIPEVRIEPDAVLAQSRVYASAYWSPAK
jgi:hypothetical protein